MQSDTPRIRIYAEGESFDGSLVDSSLGSEKDAYEVYFPLKESPTLAVGSTVEFEVLGGGEDGAASGERLQGVVRRFWHARQWRRYLLRCEPEGADDQPREERRGTVRLAVGDDFVQVDLAASGWNETYRPHIKDISASGLSALVADPGQVLGAGDAVEVTLHFADREPVELAGVVRYRREVGTDSLYGVAFDSEHTADFADKQALIHGLVERRRLEALASLNRPGSGKARSTRV